MIKEIKQRVIRYFLKLKINLRKKSLKLIPSEQIELLNFSKSLIRKEESKIFYCPYTGNILIRNEDKEILVKGDDIIIRKGKDLISYLLDPMIKEAVVSYISHIFEVKIQLTEEKYKNCIKELNHNSWT